MMILIDIIYDDILIVYDALLILMIYDDLWLFMIIYDDIRWLWHAPFFPLQSLPIAWHVATLGSPLP